MQHFYSAQQEGAESVLGKRAYASLSQVRAQIGASELSGQQQSGSGQAGQSAGAPNLLTTITHRPDGTAVQMILQPLAPHGFDPSALAGTAQLLVPSDTALDSSPPTFPMTEVPQQALQYHVPEQPGMENMPMVIPANWTLPMSKQQLQPGSSNMVQQAVNEAGERTHHNMVMAMLPDGRSVLVDPSSSSLAPSRVARASSQQQRHSVGMQQPSQQQQQQRSPHQASQQQQQHQNNGHLQSSGGVLRPTQHSTSNSQSGMSMGNEHMVGGQQQQQQGFAPQVLRSIGAANSNPQAVTVINKAGPEAAVMLNRLGFNTVEAPKAPSKQSDEFTMLGQLMSNSSGDLMLWATDASTLPDLSQKLVHTPQGPMQLVPLPSSIAKVLSSKPPVGMQSASEWRPSADRQQQQQQQQPPPRQTHHAVEKETEAPFRTSAQPQKAGPQQSGSLDAPIVPTSFLPHPTDANLMVVVLPDGRQLVVERVGNAVADSNRPAPAKVQGSSSDQDVLMCRTSAGHTAWTNTPQGPRSTSDARASKVARTEPSRLGMANGSGHAQQVILEHSKQQRQMGGRASGGTDPPMRGSLGYSGLSDSAVGGVTADTLKLSARSLSSPQTSAMDANKDKDGSGDAAQKLHAAGSMQGLHLQSQPSGGGRAQAGETGIRTSKVLTHHDGLAQAPAGQFTHDSHMGMNLSNLNSAGAMVLPASPFEAPFTASPAAQQQGGELEISRPGAASTSNDKGEKPEAWTVQLMCTDVGTNGVPALTPLFTLTGRVNPRVRAVLPDKLLVSELKHMKDVEQHDLAKENSFLLKLAPNYTPNQDAAVQRMQLQGLCLVCPIDASKELVISSLQVGDAKVLMGTLMASASDTQQQQQGQRQQQQSSRSKSTPGDAAEAAAGQTMLQLSALPATEKLMASGSGSMGPPPQVTQLPSWLPASSSLAQLPSMATIVDAKLAASGSGSGRLSQQQELKQNDGSLQLGHAAGEAGEARRGSGNSGGATKAASQQGASGTVQLPANLAGGHAGMVLLGGPNGPVQLPPGYMLQGSNLVNLNLNLPAPLMLGQMDNVNAGPGSSFTLGGPLTNGVLHLANAADTQPGSSEVLALPALGDSNTLQRKQQEAGSMLQWPMPQVSHSRQGAGMAGSGSHHGMEPSRAHQSQSASQRDARQSAGGTTASGGDHDAGTGSAQGHAGSRERNEHNSNNINQGGENASQQVADNQLQTQGSKGGRQGLSSPGSSQHHSMLMAALTAAARNTQSSSQSGAADAATAREDHQDHEAAARITQALQEHQQQLEQTQQRLMGIQAEGANGMLAYQHDFDMHQAGSQSEGHADGGRG